MKKSRRLWLLAPAALLAPLLAWFALPAPPPLAGLPYSGVVLDRAGQVLRLGLTPDEKYRVHTPLREIAPALIEATLVQEDQHFRSHPGVNPVAALRALGHVCLGQRGRGGASTITMQLARLRYGLHTRTARGKLLQMLRALEIERHYSKDEILEAYLNLAPYGGNLEGIGAASFLYFGKTPSALTRSEAALLSVLPQSPSRRAPHGAVASPGLLAAAGRLSARLSAGGVALPPPAWHRRSAQGPAPHLAIRTMAAHPEAAAIATTLDRDLQRVLETRIASYVKTRSREGVKNAAAMLVDTRTMELLAQSGSADFFDESISGQVDGTRSRRSPGSTLKPFIYALALDQGLIHPSTVLADAPRRFGSYNPENFDGSFAGPIKASEALARSRNVPAVALADELKRPTLYAFLKRAGVALPRDESFYGLALPLGGGEVTMEELAQLYAMLANGGRWRPLERTLGHRVSDPGRRLLSPEAAFLTLEMLGRIPRPDLDREAGSEGIYWKTGTSMGFRDAWSVAVFDHFVLAVWVGNFDGHPNPAFVGRTCAGPLLFQIIDALRQQGRAQPHPLTPPPGANLRQVELCAVSGQIPTASCTHRAKGWFIPGVSPICACEVHHEILVDAATGLRLPADDGTRAVRREVFEFWPSDLLALFEKAGLPRRRPPPFAPGEGVPGGARSGHAPQIVSPANGRIYTLGPTSGGELSLQARTEADVTKLYWFCGKTLLGTTSPRVPLAWHPTPGEYRVTALDDQGRSSTSAVTLEAASATRPE